MGTQSLKELLEKDSKDQDLVGLLRKVENSYICKGFDYLDNKVRLREHYPNSKLAKAIDFSKDFLFYSNVLGLLPGEKQEKYAKYLGHDKLTFMKYSLTYGFMLTGLKFTIALAFPTPIACGIYALGFITAADTIARLTYTLIKKKPIGSFIYTEFPYRILKPLLNKLSRKKNHTYTGTKDLNNHNNISLS